MAPIDDFITLVNTLGTVITNIAAALTNLPTSGGASPTQVAALTDTVQTELANAQGILAKLTPSSGGTSGAPAVSAALSSIANAVSALPTSGDVTDTQLATFVAVVTPLLAAGQSAVGAISPSNSATQAIAQALNTISSAVSALPTSGGLPAAQVQAFVVAVNTALGAATTALGTLPQVTASARRGS
jgi:hypothetical protein